MSEHAEVEEVVEAADAAEESSMLQRFRWPLLAGGIVLGLLVFLLIGMVLGTVRQRSVDHKLQAAQVAGIKQQAKLSEEESKVQAAKAESFRLTAENRKVEIAELRSKLDCVEAAASQAQAAEQAEQEKQAAIKKEAQGKSGSKAKVDIPVKSGYVRFSNTSCTLIAGKGNADGLECLKQGVNDKSAKPAEMPAKAEEKTAASVINWRECLKQGASTVGDSKAAEERSHKPGEAPAHH